LREESGPTIADKLIMSNNAWLGSGKIEIVFG